VQAGGLGFRKAGRLAQAAHLASVIEAEPFARYLCAQAIEAGVVANNIEGMLDE
jgi:hypothetical protein